MINKNNINNANKDSKINNTITNNNNNTSNYSNTNNINNRQRDQQNKKTNEMVFAKDNNKPKYPSNRNKNNNYKENNYKNNSYNKDMGSLRQNYPSKSSPHRSSARIKQLETVEDIKLDIERIEKEIRLEIKEIKSLRLGV